MSENTQLLTVQNLLEELKEVDDWYLFGAYLGVPVYKLNEIQSEHKGVVERCKLNMLQYWLDNTLTASWREVIRVVEQMDKLALAAKLKRKYLWGPPTTSEESVSASAQPAAAGDTEPSPTAPYTADIEADVKVVRGIQDLESSFSAMLRKLRDTLTNCDISGIQFFLNDLFDTDEFSSCDTIDKVLRQLRQGHVDTFNVYYLQQLISECQQNEAIDKSIKEYEEKKERFLEATTVKQFQQAIVSKAETLPPKGMAEMTIRIPAELNINESNKRTLKDVEKLARRAFQGCENSFISIKVKPGSIIITWYVPESLCEELERLARENAAVLREEGVEEVTIVGKKRVFLSTDEEWLKENNHETTVVQEQAAVIARLKSELKSVEENFEAVNKLLIMKEAELKRRVGGMESTLGHLVQVNGEGKEIATAGQMTSFELIDSSQANLSLPFSLDQLSCQLTDPNSQHVECSIISNQPGMATVSYTPTLRGAHQLRITVGDVDIPGSPFTVRVLPSLEMRGVPINTITRVRSPWGVAVSENGEILISERKGHCISVFSREGKKIRQFGSSEGLFDSPSDVAITTDNHILVADTDNNRIQMFTMEGEFVRSVGKYGNGPLQFTYLESIAVHPSGLVFVADDRNHRIQVLHPDLSLSHMFGSKGSRPGQFIRPDGVACDSSGIVYVTDYDNHRVQLFSADGQFISSFGCEGSQPGQLYHPHGICIDSTDTVYVTDHNHRVSAFSTDGQFLKCFGKKGNGIKGELLFPKGMAVDNTTGNIYVCDCANNRVVVY